MAASARIAALFYYPIKSARGIELEQAELTAAGLAHDRRWMIITSAGRYLTQREWPRLALVHPALSSTALRLEAPSVPTLPPLVIALARQGERRRVQIWQDEVAAFDEGDAAAEWLERLLGTRCRLVRFDPAQRRLSSSQWTGAYEAENRFSDGYPLLLLSAASLADLNRRLPVPPLPVNRFRPSVLLDGLDPYAEDQIDALRCDGIHLKLVKPCTRCVITTTNQLTGVPEGDEPLRTLRSYRYDKQLRGVCFGQNTIVIEGAGRTLRRGQELAIEWKRSTPQRELGGDGDGGGDE